MGVQKQGASRLHIDEKPEMKIILGEQVSEGTKENKKKKSSTNIGSKSKRDCWQGPEK